MIDSNKLIEEAKKKFEDIQTAGRTIVKVKKGDEWIDIPWPGDVLSAIDSPADPNDKIANGLRYIASLIESDDEEAEETEEDVEVVNEDEDDEDEEEEVEEPVTAAPVDGGDKLPEDFPGYDELVDADILTFTELKAYMEDNDLKDVHGIGKVTADKIKDRLS